MTKQVRLGILHGRTELVIEGLSLLPSLLQIQARQNSL